jgi:hypothetical protein
MTKKIFFISVIAIISLLAILIFVFGLQFDINGKATGIFSLKCTDSDGGLSYYEKGFVKYDGKTKTDSCNKNYLTEWYCKTFPFSKRYKCDNGCKDGACIKKTCTDTDGGKNYVLKGTATGIDGNIQTDYCRKDNTYQLVEFWCNTNYQTLNNEIYYCPYGCVDGACIEKTYITNCSELKGKEVYISSPDHILTITPNVISLKEGETASIELMAIQDQREYYVSPSLYSLALSESGREDPLVLNPNGTVKANNPFTRFGWSKIKITSKCEYIPNKEAMVLVGDNYVGDNVIYVWPMHYFDKIGSGLYTDEVMRIYEINRITDYVFQIMKNATEYDPYSGRMPISFEYGACGGVVGISDPVIIGPDCYQGDDQNNYPSINTVSHEIGHTFLPEANGNWLDMNRRNNFVETFNNALYIYSYKIILGNSDNYPINTQNYNMLNYWFNRERQNRLNRFHEFDESKYKLYANSFEHDEAINGLILSIIEDSSINPYGYDAYKRFFLIVSRKNVDDLEVPEGDEDTFFIASLSAAVSSDLRETFNEYGFPIDNAYFEKIYSMLKVRI